ncbi:glycoside hydrolase family 5 protein [Xanthomonas graminis]|uniref:Glycoside hydrolase family 5 n=2 Tax=Xanthomonas translucens group TaxID=3390202 RepID=A0A0K2ZXW0_9XANT|nr:glycoside hydrolase family 5 protein [Xanthomonas translucens]UKE65514.1 glycoside hydrolase family 5 protein [Xanthomonas translucens pv. phlei]CTP90523.1 glycoside hydrolase family 5 [Xanthomonas translucens pv. phlei]
MQRNHGFPTIAMLLALVMLTPLAHADAFARLGRGINVLGYDPLWTDASRARFRPALYRAIHDGGFQTVRVNLQAFAHMDAANQLDPAWLHTLDSVVDQASAAGLNVILDEHDFHPCAQDAASCRTRLLAFWKQIATRYRNAPPSVLFELLNEPNGELTSDRWNALLGDALRLIRREHPTRTVVIGPANGNAFTALGALRLPEDDPNILVTVHYYNPFRFTHQGAPWVRPDIRNASGVAWGGSGDRAKLYRQFDAIADWATAHHRQILLGEFGAYEKAPHADRLAWTTAVVNAAEKRHFAWAYWQFEGSFGAYDIGQGHWIEPLHRALVSSDGAYSRRRPPLGATGANP